MPGAESTITVNTPPSVLYGVIADYEAYPQFLKDISAVRVLRRDGDEAEVEFHLNLIRTVDYTLHLKGTPPTGVSWSLVRSSILKSNDGGWRLEDLGDGRTRATYRLDIGVGLLVPRRLVSSLTGTTLPATLNAFKERAEKLHQK